MGVLDLLRLDGRVALVTGASRGLGLQIAEGLGEAGARVAITARRVAGLESASTALRERGITCLAIPCDVADPASAEPTVQRVLDEFGRLDVLVNNAGATWGAPFDQIPREAWEKVLRTNVDGAYFMSRAAAVEMARQGEGGRIINVASVAGLRGIDPRIMQALPYNTSKGALVNFTRDLAAKLAEHQITVNCVCPGFFPTRMTAHTLEVAGDLILDRIPLRRLGGPEDLKGLLVLLASQASSYITGQVIAVDGGLTAV